MHSSLLASYSLSHRTKFMKAKQRAVENQQDLVDILGVKQTSEASSETPTVLHCNLCVCLI
jgi:hypothetical protein